MSRRDRSQIIQKDQNNYLSNKSPLIKDRDTVTSHQEKKHNFE